MKLNYTELHEKHLTKKWSALVKRGLTRPTSHLENKQRLEELSRARAEKRT